MLGYTLMRTLKSLVACPLVLAIATGITAEQPPAVRKGASP